MKVDAKYETIYRMLKNDILSGKYSLQDPLPSITMLMRKFKIANVTAVKVCDKLKESGLVHSVQGRGTFVTRGASSRKIGLLLSGLTYSEYFQPIATEFMQLARDNGYSLCFGAIQSNDPEARISEAREIVADFIRNQVAGVVYHPLDYSFDNGAANFHILKVLDKARVAVVLFDSDVVEPPNRSKYDVVSIDNVKAGELLGRHMLETGARNIHFLLRPNCIPNALCRVRGVMNASVFAGCGWSDKNILIADPTDVAAIRRHIAKRPRPDAFVCENDTMAAEFRRSLEKLEIQVPEQMRLAGFDDVNIARLLSPPLTSIHQPCGLIAKAAFTRLLERIKNPSLPPVEVFFSGTLTKRKSTSTPKISKLKRKVKK